jgi:hypothetical protein
MLHVAHPIHATWKHFHAHPAKSRKQWQEMAIHSSKKKFRPEKEGGYGNIFEG